MKRLAVLMSAAWLALSGAVALAESPVVVELYTSQGCSSCPPADALLLDMADREDIIALALHVDYWDYLGWQDTMGDPAYTRRQKGYAHAAGSKSIYTPQMIVGGRLHVIGHRPMKLTEAINASRGQGADVDLTLRRSGETLSVTAEPAANLPRSMSVFLVRYIPRYDVAIKRGENAGRTITYANAVTDWREIATWNGRSRLTLRETVQGNQPIVVIVQSRGHGPIVAASRLR